VYSTDFKEDHPMSWHRHRGRKPVPPPLAHNPIVMAISNGDQNHLRHLLKSGSNPDAAHGDTCPLVFATHRCDPDVVVLLLDHKANIDTPDSKGRTALMIAATGDRLDILATLIARGADIHRGDQHGNTALMHAVLNKNHTAVEKIIQAGADVQQRNRYGDSAAQMMTRPEYTGLQSTAAAAFQSKAEKEKQASTQLADEIRVLKPLRLRPRL
jgi:ankyrin repeat protein